MGGRLDPRAHPRHGLAPRPRDALKPAAHLTCVAATKDEVDEVVRSYWDAGVRHIVALRGDPVGGIGTVYEAHPGGYGQTCDLVAGIKAIGDFEVSVSAYPEKHPEAASLEADIDALKAKVDCGADRAITQFFFDNDLYFRYLDRVRARGIDIPIVPGIVPVQNFKQTANFAAKAGASVPDWLAARFEGLDNDVETRKLIAAAVAAEQVIDLVDRGVSEFHFYTMNRADLVYAICHLLGCATERRPREADSRFERAAFEGIGGCNLTAMQKRNRSNDCHTPRPANGADVLKALREASRRSAFSCSTAPWGRRCSARASRKRISGASAFQDWKQDLKGNNDLLILTQPDAVRKSTSTISAPAPTSSRPTPSPAPPSPRPITAWRRSSTSSTARSAACARGGADRREGGRPPPLRRRCRRPDQPHAVDLAGREQSRLSRRHLRSGARCLCRAGEGADRRRRPRSSSSRRSSTRSTPRRRSSRRIRSSPRRA